MNRLTLIFGLNALAFALGGFFATKASGRFGRFGYTGSGYIMSGSNIIGTFSGLTSAKGFTTNAAGNKLVELIKTNGPGTTSFVLGTVKTSNIPIAHAVYHN